MNGTIKPDILPVDSTIRFMHLTKFDKIEDLNFILNDYHGTFYKIGLYYAERISDQVLLAHFWSLDHAENAAKRLKK